MKMKKEMINPGIFELFYGPMKSGKSEALIKRVQDIDEKYFMVIKPTFDDRDGPFLKSRACKEVYGCKFVDESEPFSVFDLVSRIHLFEKPNLRMILIDEIEFFDKDLELVIPKLCLMKYNIIAAGLDLDFRGEYFGNMSNIMALADKTQQLYANCEYPGCKNKATKTQRLVDGKPAFYDEKVNSIEGESVYEARCLEHHFVPRR